MGTSTFIITANHLLGGHVVAMAQDGSWHADINQARVFDTKSDAQTEMDAAQGDQDVVVGLELTPVDSSTRPVTPVLRRDRIRFAGPSSAALISVPAALPSSV